MSTKNNWGNLIQCKYEYICYSERCSFLMRSHVDVKHNDIDLDYFILKRFLFRTFFGRKTEWEVYIAMCIRWIWIFASILTNFIAFFSLSELPNRGSEWIFKKAVNRHMEIDFFCCVRNQSMILRFNGPNFRYFVLLFFHFAYS